MSKVRTIVGMLARVDWPTVLHRSGAFMRELRGDAEIEDDQMQSRAVAKKTRDAFQQFGRQAIGCAKPNPCECGFCKEESERETP